MRLKDTEVRMVGNERNLGTAIGNIGLPRHPKAIGLEDLKPGDILLHRPRSPKLHQAAISRATRSPFTHASIYLGTGRIAHSTPPKVRIDELSAATADDMYAGVLRSPVGFDAERVTVLNEFINTLVKKGTKYDLSGLVGFSGRNKKHFEDVLAAVQDNYGQHRTQEEFEGQAYFCSALVAACFAVVGIIGESAQAAYPPDVLSPGDLHRDATFGWFVGYLIQNDQQVPEDDPLPLIMHWSDR